MDYTLTIPMVLHKVVDKLKQLSLKTNDFLICTKETNINSLRLVRMYNTVEILQGREK